MRVRYEQYFNYVVLCLFTELVKADYNSKFHPSIKNPRQSNPDIKNGSLLMAKNVNVLCWALFQDALFELSTCGKWLRACLHGGGGPQIGVVACGGSPNLSDVTVIALKWDIIWTGGLPLPPPLVARKNADSLNTMILDFLVDFKTGESRVFSRLPFPAYWVNIIFYAALYRTLRTTLLTNVLWNAVKAGGCTCESLKVWVEKHQGAIHIH